MNEALETIKAWADVISSVGVTGVLAGFLWLFYKGEILSKKSVETIIANMALQLKDFFRDELKEALDEKTEKRGRVF
jgi:hypothetical protein